MEFELLDNSTENSTFDPNQDYAFELNYYAEIPTSIVAILSSIANVLIIFMTIRFRELHTRPYFYLANWCLCNFGITATTHTVWNILGVAEIVSNTCFCIWIQITFAFVFGNLMFVVGLSLDWYIVTFSNQSYCALKCRRHYKLIAIVIWVLTLLLLVKSVLYCLNLISIPLLIFLACLAYFSVTVVILIISILRMIKLRVSSVVVEKSNVEFKIALSHLLCWLPNVIFIICHAIFRLTIIFEYISYIIWYSNACVVFFILYRYDENFRTCLGVLFKTKFTTTAKDNRDINLISV